jgi:Methylamine utilisation protein MauE
MTGEALARLLTGPFLAACALLAVAGAAKFVQPASARSAVQALRLPANAAGIRVLGAIELAVALSGALVGGSAALLVAACYALLTGAALMLWRTAPGTPCGCLGAAPTPARGGHFALNAIAAVIATIVAAGPTPLSVLRDQPVLGIPLLVLTACATWLGALAMDALPTLRAAVQEGSS